MVSAIALGAAACSPEERNFGDSSSSSSSSGAGGNGGSAMACKPDETEACYNGPAETLEVGVCKGGTHVCLPGGEGFGECGGEVLPTVENCLTPEDEACNGNDPKECPTLADGWLEAFGTAGSGQYVHALAITNTGDIVVVGSFGDTLDFGMGPMASTGSSDIFVAKFDQLGKVIWNRRFGDASSQSAFAVGVDSMGAIYVGGSMVGNVDFDGTLLTSAGSADAFLARFDPDGKLVWAKNWGDINPQYVRHIEVTKTNLIIVAGEFGGTIQFDANGQNKLTAVGGSDVFVARFDTSGFLSGSRGFGGTFNDSVRGLALDSANRVYLTGGYDGTANFGGPMLTSTGARDGYVVALTATLNTTSAFGFGNPNGPNSYQEAYDVVVNDIDEVIVSGGFTEGLELPGQFLSNSDPLSRSMFLAQFAPQLGSVTLAKQFGGVGGSVNDARLAIDPVAKQLVIAGAFTGDMDFGGGLLHAEAAADPYFAKLAADGAFVAARLLPNEVAVIDNPNNISCLALLPVGDLIIGGTLRTPILYGNKAVGTIDAKDGNALLGRFLH
jgi:hypothetical protein